jgi:DNA-binding transcriptional ArsR family regulator
MSRSRPERRAPSANRAARASHAAVFAEVFAALGDETRLALIGKLSGGPPQSISRLTEGSALTRQAITKHLRVLEGAGVVRSVRAGRENLFALRPEPLRDVRSYLDHVSAQWDDALGRLKAFVEK